MTLALLAYQAATRALAPLAPSVLEARARRGKEDLARLSERLGRAAAQRPAGPLVWLHGASVGESRLLVAIGEALQARRSGLELLFTSGTTTSAAMLSARLPPHARHQFAPVDEPAAVRRFLAHWRPDVGVFAESDVWPNLTLAAAKSGVRLALVNARMSPKSLAGWRRWGASARKLFAGFEIAIAADQRTAEGLSDLLARPVAAPGNLKLAAPPPAVDQALKAQLAAAIGARPLWVAASTHPGEDEIALCAHARLRERWPEALLVLAPRHPERGPAVAALAQDAPRRAEGAAPRADHPVFVLDTIGELASVYALAPAALVAGSLLPHLKGHNPAEPIQLGAAPVSGPYVESFSDVFAALARAEAVREAADAAAIAGAIAALWSNEAERAAQIARGRETIAAAAVAFARTIEALLPLVPEAV